MTDDQPSSIAESEWIDTDAPAEGQIVQVRAQDGSGFYVLPFIIIFHDDEWWNARTEERLDCFVAAWRPLNGLPHTRHDPQPFEPTSAKPASIPIEDLNAENDE
jgi:hypothetical protein